MLPYHIIYPQKRQQNDSEFLHYLSLGSYQTSFSHPNILAFSKITLHPKKHLPKLTYDDLKAKCESQGYKLHRVMIPLYGNFAVDQKPISNVLELEPNEKGEQNKDSQTFVIKECNYVQDFQYISNKQQKDKSGVFLFILYKTSHQIQGPQQQQLKQSNRFTQSINKKQLLRFPIVQGSGDVELSLVQVLESTKIKLMEGDMVYLEKGKIKILEQGEGLEIRNKGNRKGEQNYINNMVYVAEQMEVDIQKGSLVFIASGRVAIAE